MKNYNYGKQTISQSDSKVVNELSQLIVKHVEGAYEIIYGN